MFKKTRIKLTGWYLLIIMFISVSFSMVIYRFEMNELQRIVNLQKIRLERRLSQGEYLTPGTPQPQITPNLPVIDQELVEETKGRMLLTLFGVNLSIFVIAGGLGYFLAGKTLDPIAQMLDEQNRFITDSSHELRTPLTSLKSAMEVNLRDKNLTLADAKKLIAENITEVNNLQSLSDKLLELAQFEKPQEQLARDTIPVKKLIQTASQKISALAKVKNITIKSKIPDLSVRGNIYNLTELFVILLDNAIKYSPAKSTVNITAIKKDGSLSIRIEDHGIGIAEKDLPHIFERFFRSENSRSKIDVSGYGLGLSIAKKIVDIYHGSIMVKSKLNSGSTFTVTLPYKEFT